MRSVVLVCFLCLSSLGAQTPEVIHLWPNGPPGQAAFSAKEADTTTAKDNLIAGRSVVRLGNISDPTITISHPPKDKDTGASIIVFPGGGYQILALDLEGSEVTAWLNSIGVTGIVLKYRVPAGAGSPREAAPLQDAQRAVSLVRENAARLGLDPQRIGVLGFSAGGHLAANLSTHFVSQNAPANPSSVSSRPDFALLIYPAYLTQKDDLTRIAPELQITPDTPPTFLVQAEDDAVHVENSLVYFEALKQAKIPAELHIYSIGGHGYGLRPTEQPVTHWPQLAERWLHSRGLLNTR